MKIRTSVISLLCTAALLLSCSGCSALSSYFIESREDVLLRMSQYTDGRTPTAAAAEVNLSMTSHAGDSATDISVSLKSHILLASDTDSYADGEFSYTVNGKTVSDSAQVYNFAENGALHTFTYAANADRWFRTDSSLPEQPPKPTPTPAPTPTEGESTEPQMTIPEPYEFLLLEEGTQTLGDTEVYVLTGTVDGESCVSLLQDALLSDALTARLRSAAPKGSDLSAIDLKQLDFSAITADVVLYVSKETCAPMQMELTLSGLNLLITDLMGMLPPQAIAFLGTSLSIEPVRITLTDITFEPVTMPALPEEARVLSMQESFDPNRGDGTYVLQQLGDCVMITPQSGWTVSELGYCFAGFHNPDRTRSAFYELYRNTSPEDFIASVEQGMIPAMEAHELTVTTAAGDPIGDYQTYSIKGDAVNVYLAYRTVGNSLLGIYAEDSSGANAAAVLTPILDAVSDYEIEY
ncbi:MAG: hypothetical protein IJD81_02480 [Oscillospiraceae bacterium]|nr:hypothetical protein [Oscillospiraceae bacterium]